MRFSTVVALALSAVVYATPIEPRSNSGTATWFTQDGTTGACGKRVSDSSKVVALCPGQWSRKCGKKVKIHDNRTGKSVVATVNDECPECSCSHLDLSLGAYDALGQSRDVGVLKISYEWL